jgi:hypothetical protein
MRAFHRGDVTGGRFRIRVRQNCALTQSRDWRRDCSRGDRERHFTVIVTSGSMPAKAA